jgi:hypothetical protein
MPYVQPLLTLLRRASTHPFVRLDVVCMLEHMIACSSISDRMNLRFVTVVGHHESCWPVETGSCFLECLQTLPPQATPTHVSAYFAQVKIDKPIMRIPMLAIHLNRTIGTDGFNPNKQTELVPILATAARAQLLGTQDDSKSHHNVLLEALAKEAGCAVAEIVDLELHCCDTQPGQIGGIKDEFVFVGRLDNLAMSWCSMQVRPQLVMAWVCQAPCTHHIHSCCHVHVLRSPSCHAAVRTLRTNGSLVPSVGTHRQYSRQFSQRRTQE